MSNRYTAQSWSLLDRPHRIGWWGRHAGLIKWSSITAAATIPLVFVAWQSVIDIAGNLPVLRALLDNANLEMVRPHLQGSTVNSDGSPGYHYDIRANSARLDGINIDSVQMVELYAELSGRKSYYAIEAGTGRFSRADQLLVLRGDVRIFSQDGHVIEADSLLAELKKDTIRSSEVIRINGPIGWMVADGGLLMADGGTRLVLYGPVRAEIQGGQLGSSADAGNGR